MLNLKNSLIIMINIVCEIYNQIDKKNFTLYVKWFESHFSVMLLEPTMTPLSGEMNTDDIEYFCNELSKSQEDYLQETKEIFYGKHKEIQYCIKDKSFEWKKNVWTLGRVQLCPILNTKFLSEKFQDFLNFHQTVQNKLSILQEENECLMSAKKKLTTDIEQMIENQSSLEKGLYKKFVLILNSKKKKLKELENIIKMKESPKESVFTGETDEDEESEDESSMKSKSSFINSKIRKRKSGNSVNFESIHESKKPNYTVSTKSVIIDKTHADSESCSDNQILEDFENSKNKSMRHVRNCDISQNKHSTLDLTTEESEEDLFSS